MRIHPGTIQTLPVFEITDKGFFLGDDQEKVLVPKREVHPTAVIGTEVEVFTYYNQMRDLEATTRLPQIQVGQIGCFRAGNSNDLGTFIDIGINRDVLIPNREQGEFLEEGKMALVILLDDPENRRLYASTRLGKHLDGGEIPYKRGDEVTMTIAEKIDIGRRVVVDGKFIAALFRQEMTDNVRLGEKVKGYIRKVEGKDIIVSMQREGLDLLEDSKEKLMTYLEMNGGYVRLNDDTDPEEVKLRLHMSKKAFKKAAGMLFKEGKVLLTKFGIKINKSGEIPEGWEKEKFDDEHEVMPDKPEPKTFKEKGEEKKALARKLEAGTEEGKEKVSRPRVLKPTTATPKPRVVKSEEPEEKPAPPRRRDDDDDDAPIRPVKKELTFKGKK